MIPNELGLQLHDRVTRGERLNADELVQLDTWYAEQDQAEFQELSHEDDTVTKDMTVLRGEIDAALLRLETLTGQVRRIAGENEQLRSDISALRRQVSMQFEVA